jgi:hypothetical protein
MRTKLRWPVLGGWLVLVSISGLVLWWRVAGAALERQIERKQSDLKRLHLGGALPPTREVVDYLEDRAAALETQYSTALTFVAPGPSAINGPADPQLHFQQRVHEVQRALERLAAARGVMVPLQLGIPKELPPIEAVPRFLIQLGLIEEAAELLLGIPEVTQVVSFKLEDPQAVAPIEESTEGFVTRLPVRVRLNGSLQALPKILGMIDHANPMIDLQGLELMVAGKQEPSETAAKPLSKGAAPTGPSPAANVGAQDPQRLDMEFVLVRYLIQTNSPR